MPITVVRQTIDGKRLDEAVPRNAALNRLLPIPEDTSFPMIRFIDPFGDTLFSSNQMIGFLPEWDRLRKDVSDKEDGQFLDRDPFELLRFTKLELP
jgi:hypothetical protein